ncbi:MAG: hypothetical protein EB168_09745, partial [Euryarchaeota archaeon]|nr:hypothetical protein [Euryarchaeota archaeon]
VTALFLEENGRVHIRSTGDLVISDVSEWSEGVQDIASAPLANLAMIEGEATVIGSTNHGLTSIPEEAWDDVISVHALGNTLFVRKSDGTVVAWGSDQNNHTSELVELVPGTTPVRYDGGVEGAPQLVLAPGGTNVTVDPGLNTFEYNNSIYFSTLSPMTWQNAEAWANTQGGHLVSIEDAEEQAFLTQTFNSSYWIGLYRVNNSWDTPEWSNGSTSTYRNWSPGEPNGPGPGGEPAAHMQHGGTWNDLSDHAGLYGIVEISDTKILQISTFLSGEGSQAGLIDSHGQLYVWGSTEGGIGEVPANMLGGVKQAEMGQDFVIALVGDNDADHLPDIFETETGEYISSTDTGTSPNNPDEDQDGILDGDEVALYGSNPLSTDSDDDGLSDTLELSLGLSLTSSDSDEDTFTDNHEHETGTDPLDPNEYPEDFGESAINIIADTTNDSDGDGLTDGEEINIYQTNPDVADQDDDGLNDGQEVEIGTLADNADSDEDGYEDGHEYEVGTDPLNPDEVPEGEGESAIDVYADTTNDTDGDGLTDGEEQNIYNTNPELADQDQDGLNDGQEVALGTLSDNPDSDDDGYEDGHEY